MEFSRPIPSTCIGCSGILGADAEPPIVAAAAGVDVGDDDNDDGNDAVNVNSAGGVQRDADLNIESATQRVQLGRTIYFSVHEII